MNGIHSEYAGSKEPRFAAPAPAPAPALASPLLIRSFASRMPATLGETGWGWLTALVALCPTTTNHPPPLGDTYLWDGYH
jgi:hypothetical protein